MMRIAMKLGRFASEPHRILFTKLHAAYRQSREQTQAELTASQIAKSLESDIRKGAKPKPHGHDVISIANLALSNVQRRIPTELKAAEAAMIKAEIEAAEEFLRDRIRRLQELEASSNGYNNRALEIQMASQRVKEREAV